MSRKKTSGNKNSSLEKIVLVTALINLLNSIVNFVKSLS